MFRGAAWFSPSVPRHIRRQWVRYGGKKAGRGRDGIRRRLWYCFCNGPDDPKLAEKLKCEIPGPYHALWVLESVKLGRALSMQDYIIDEPLQPGLDIVLQSPKRKPRALTFNPSISSSPYTIGTTSDDQDSSILDFTYRDGDTTIDSGDFDELFQSPSRLLDFRKDQDNASLSWDITPSLTYEFNDEETDKSQVEMLIDTEESPTAKDLSDWPEMTLEASNPARQSPATLELDASAVLSNLSSLYPHALANSTGFVLNLEYGGKPFAAIRKTELKKT